jgi:hypothetical protein
MGDLYEPGSFDGWETHGGGELIHHRDTAAKCPNCGLVVSPNTPHQCGGLPVGAVGDPVLYRLSSQDVMTLGEIASKRSAPLSAVSGSCVAGVVVGHNTDGTCNLLLFLDSTIGPQRAGHRPVGDRPGEFRVRS